MSKDIELARLYSPHYFPPIYEKRIEEDEIVGVFLEYEEEIHGALDYYWQCGECGNDINDPIPFKEFDKEVADYLNNNDYFEYEFRKMALIEVNQPYCLRGKWFNVVYKNSGFEVINGRGYTERFK